MSTERIPEPYVGQPDLPRALLTDAEAQSELLRQVVAISVGAIISMDDRGLIVHDPHT